MKKTIIIWTIIFGFQFVYSQSETDSLNGQTQKIKWKFLALLELSTVDFIQDNSNETRVNYISDASSLRIGGSLRSEKIFSEFNFGIGGIETKIKYDLPKNKFLQISFKTLRYDDLDDTPYYDNDINKIRFNEYLGSFGVDIPFKNGKSIALNVSSGVISSNKYQSNEYDNYQNKKIKIKQSAKLNATAIYGMGFRYDFNPLNLYFFNSQLKCYFTFTYLFNNKSNFLRTVEVEEWIPDNLVYQEKTSDINHKIRKLSFKLVAQW